MRIAKLGAFALVALSLLSTDPIASPINRKFHPVVNDDPQNAHLNVQTPGADINQTITINAVPGTDGQVIPAGETRVASCAAKDANGDIDLSGESTCSAPAASAPVAARATVTAPTSAPVLPPSTRTASQIVRVPSITAAPVAPTANVSASSAAPNVSTHAVEAGAAPLPAHRTEIARAAASRLPAKQPAPAGVTFHELAGLWWLATGLTAAVIVFLGLVLLFRLGQAELLRMRRDEDEEGAAQDGPSAIPAFPAPRGPY